MLLALSTGEWEKLESIYNTETVPSENSWPTDMISGIVWNFYVSFIKIWPHIYRETNIRDSDITDLTPPKKIKWQKD